MPFTAGAQSWHLKKPGMLEAGKIKIIKTSLNVDAYLGMVPERVKRPALAMLTLNTTCRGSIERTETKRRGVIISLKVHANSTMEAKQIQSKITRLFDDNFFDQDGIDYRYEMITTVIGANDTFSSTDYTASVDVHFNITETPLQ